MADLYITNRDEVYRLDSTSILYIKADGNYSEIVLQNSKTFTICKPIGKLIDHLNASLGDGARTFCRIGKSLVINLRHIQQLSTPNQKIILSDGRTFTKELTAKDDQITKDLIKTLRQCIVSGVIENGNTI